MQEVLQADWQVLLHSPQPVFFLALGVATNLILFIIVSFNFPYILILSRATQNKGFRVYPEVVTETLIFGKNFRYL